MKKSLLCLIAVLLISSMAFAHRLNEYLEATTISLSRGKVFVELRLTPGVAVVQTVLKEIDPDNNNLISASEQHAYLAVLGRDISLTVDGRNIALNPVSFAFPTIDAMRNGTGDIIVDYEAGIQGQSPTHQLVLKNNHFKDLAVYMVNCLLPADTTIRVTDQTRNASQSVYQLNLIIGNTLLTVVPCQHALDKANNRAVTKTYFVHGVHHILTGYDHLLFLCALVLGAAGLWDLIKIVTAFTIAHSITLTLATLGYAHLPEYIVEPLISASIVFVAVQNIFWPKQANGNSRLVVAFFFGLFHGLGFAGGLLQLMHAMPNNLIVYAILGFSLGVEAGNQLVLLPLYFAIRYIKRFKTKSTNGTGRIKFQQFASAAVAIFGIYYLIIALAG